MQEPMAGELPTPADAFVNTLPAVPLRRRLGIEFTGSGSEYFRIWIVNLLLILVTLGFYLPFAKARRISYFYANTRIDGHALAFHGDPWRMFRGFVLLGVLMIAYGVAGKLSPMAGLIAFGVLCAVWPALWRASLQFRLANTSWRGLRFGFRGDLAGAYKAVLPVYLPSIMMVSAAFLLDPQHNAAAAGTYLTVVGVAMLLMLIVLPWGMALIKRYQHGGYAYAAQRTHLVPGAGAFFVWALKGLGVGLLCVLLSFALAFGGMFAVALGGKFQIDAPAGQMIGFVVVAISYLFIFVSVGPYFAARLQDLVWSGTRSEALQFESALSFRSLAWLTTKNLLLTVITLGLYRPFAAVNTARLRLQAVGVQLDGDIEDWVAAQGAGHQDAAGEAAGDFFGIDMGL